MDLVMDNTPKCSLDQLSWGYMRVVRHANLGFFVV